MSDNKNGGIKITDEYIRKLGEQRKAEAEERFKRSVLDFAEAYYELPEEERQALQQDAKAGYSMAEKEARHVARMQAREAAARGAGAAPRTGAPQRSGATPKAGSGFKFCPYCGGKLNQSFKFCPSCGRQLT